MHFDRYEPVRGGPDDDRGRWPAGMRLKPVPTPISHKVTGLAGTERGFTDAT